MRTNATGYRRKALKTGWIPAFAPPVGAEVFVRRPSGPSRANPSDQARAGSGRPGGEGLSGLKKDPKSLLPRTDADLSLPITPILFCRSPHGLASRARDDRLRT